MILSLVHGGAQRQPQIAEAIFMDSVSQEALEQIGLSTSTAPLEAVLTDERGPGATTSDDPFPKAEESSSPLQTHAARFASYESAGLTLTGPSHPEAGQQPQADSHRLSEINPIITRRDEETAEQLVGESEGDAVRFDQRHPYPITFDTSSALTLKINQGSPLQAFPLGLQLDNDGQPDSEVNAQPEHGSAAASESPRLAVNAASSLSALNNELREDQDGGLRDNLRLTSAAQPETPLDVSKASQCDNDKTVALSGLLTDGSASLKREPREVCSDTASDDNSNDDVPLASNWQLSSGASAGVHVSEHLKNSGDGSQGNPMSSPLQAGAATAAGAAPATPVASSVANPTATGMGSTSGPKASDASPAVPSGPPTDNHGAADAASPPGGSASAAVSPGDGGGGPSGSGGSSRYESQKRRDWHTFGQYLKNRSPPLTIADCGDEHVLEFLRYLDQFGKTKVHVRSCMHYGSNAAYACPCPMRQAWGSLDSLIGRLRAAFEENGGATDANPFASRAVRLHLREVRETQGKARGMAYDKKKRKRAAAAAAAADAAAARAEEEGPGPASKSLKVGEYDFKLPQLTAATADRGGKLFDLGAASGAAGGPGGLPLALQAGAFQTQAGGLQTNAGSLLLQELVRQQQQREGAGGQQELQEAMRILEQRRVLQQQLQLQLQQQSSSALGVSLQEDRFASPPASALQGQGLQQQQTHHQQQQLEGLRGGQPGLGTLSMSRSLTTGSLGQQQSGGGGGFALSAARQAAAAGGGGAASGQLFSSLQPDQSSSFSASTGSNSLLTLSAIQQALGVGVGPLLDAGGGALGNSSRQGALLGSNQGSGFGLAQGGRDPSPVPAVRAQTWSRASGSSQLSGGATRGGGGTSQALGFGTSNQEVSAESKALLSLLGGANPPASGVPPPHAQQELSLLEALGGQGGGLQQDSAAGSNVTSDAMMQLGLLLQQYRQKQQQPPPPLPPPPQQQQQHADLGMLSGCSVNLSALLQQLGQGDDRLLQMDASLGGQQQQQQPPQRQALAQQQARQLQQVVLRQEEDRQQQHALLEQLLGGGGGDAARGRQEGVGGAQGVSGSAGRGYSSVDVKAEGFAETGAFGASGIGQDLLEALLRRTPTGQVGQGMDAPGQQQQQRLSPSGLQDALGVLQQVGQGSEAGYRLGGKGQMEGDVLQGVTGESFMVGQWKDMEGARDKFGQGFS